ncbi:hypothetical protein L7F22_047776 [Adiantum nelumboides]|nr:hypothetical protein [Adiantum nelumboides]
MKKLCRWVHRQIFVYNITFGLYMLDWWERLLFNLLVILLIWFLCYNGSQYTASVLRGAASVFYNWPSPW